VTTERKYEQLRGRLPNSIVRLGGDAVGSRDLVILGLPRP